MIPFFNEILHQMPPAFVLCTCIKAGSRVVKRGDRPGRVPVKRGRVANIAPKSAEFA